MNGLPKEAGRAKEESVRFGSVRFSLKGAER